MTDAAVAEVLACVERTLAEPSARVALEHEMTAAWPRLRRRRGGAVPKLGRARARSGDPIAPAAYLVGARHVCIRAAQATG
jgi:hypothetical protein